MTDREQEQLLATATDRFERRLSDEVSTLREGDAATRLEIANLRVEIRTEDAATRMEIANLRAELRDADAARRADIGALRLDMSERFAESQVQSEARHRELLKWAVMFWVAEAAATAGIVSALA